MAKTMKEAYYKANGGIENIKVGSLEIPEVKEGEGLVKVRAASINPVDSAVRVG